MYKFFIKRPIVAMVISIITVIVGLVTLFGLPIAQFPKSSARNLYSGELRRGRRADHRAVGRHAHRAADERRGHMNYMYSLNANNGLMRLYVNFDVKTDAKSTTCSPSCALRRPSPNCRPMCGTLV